MGIINKLRAKKEIGKDNFHQLVDFVKDKLQLSINNESTEYRRQLKAVLHNIKHAKNMQEVCAILSGLATTAMGYEIINSIINLGFDISKMSYFVAMGVLSTGGMLLYNNKYKNNHNKIIDYINTKCNIVKNTDNKSQIIDISVSEDSKNVIIESGVNELSKKYADMSYHLDV